MKDISPLLGMEVWLAEGACLFCRCCLTDPEYDFVVALFQAGEPVTCGLFGPLIIEGVIEHEQVWTWDTPVTLILCGAPRPIYREA